jgi:S-adenosylmethionine:tRNA ribosyltransferase-isomerase
MKSRELEYELPEELIAQHPVERRDSSRLLVYDRSSGEVRHRRFFELSEEVAVGELVVVNDTKVIPARLRLRRPGGGSAEILLLEPVEDGLWEALARPSARLKPGQRLEPVEFLEPLGEGRWRVRLEGEPAGEMPLPPYIERPSGELDRERYQTIFARERGAVAAPTAGLHFTPRLVGELRDRGIAVEHVTLHVGPGTFLPVRVRRVEDHRMHRERYHVPERTAAAVDEAKGRVIAVGTTALRTLEAAYDGRGVRAGPGSTDLFITPGYRFRVVHGLFTNFHLPRSTLLMLVSALAGLARIKAAYGEAVALRYRFFSYGDAMLIV